MKFSYDLIKRLVPTVSPQVKMMDDLSMYLSPAEDPQGTSFDLELPSNRYSDMASHYGVASEYAVITGKKLQEPKVKKIFPYKGKGEIEIKIANKDDCPRYGACLYELGKKGSTPAWMKKILMDCGLRPISPVVDILNYVMLEAGQPMHAFDADKLEGAIQIRRAKTGEKVVTIDDQKFTLSKEDIVIADDKGVQAIAGIKGGKPAEIGANTKRILVESASFDQVRVYKTSRSLNLRTDASARFGHGMSPHSAEIGLNRAAVLLEEIVGAKLLDAEDSYPKGQNKRVIGLDVDKFNLLMGTSFKKAEVVKKLTSLGFKIFPGKSKSKADEFMVEPPELRLDIRIFEDVAEEVIRLYGIDNLEPQPPHISLQPAKEDPILAFKDRVRIILTRLGFSEVYSTSFVDGGSASVYEVENPIAEGKTHMRQSLSTLFEKHLKHNAKFFDEVRIFELGNVFDKKLGEKMSLAIGMRGEGEEAFLDVRGATEQMMDSLGFIDVGFLPKGTELEIKVNGEILGAIKHYGKNGAIAEMDATRLLELEEGEFEYQPISKYPVVTRDLSLALREETKVGKILQEIEASGAKYVVDVDLIDYYDPKHLTFRVIFQSDERTLKDSEVTKEFNKITSYLKKKIPFEIR